MLYIKVFKFASFFNKHNTNFVVFKNILIKLKKKDMAKHYYKYNVTYI